MAEYLTTDTELTSIADAIRTKGGTSAPLVYPTGFVSAIEAIPSGGGMVTITVEQMFQGLNTWKIPSGGSIEQDQDSPWITTITAPANSMIVSFDGTQNQFISVSGLTYETVTISGSRPYYCYVFYLSTTNGTITC